MRPYAAAQLIGKVKNATPGMVIALYGVMRLVSAAFNVSFGGVAGFVRPVIMPMAVGAIEASGHKPNGTPTMEIATMAHGIEAAIEAAVSTETDPHSLCNLLINFPSFFSVKQKRGTAAFFF